MSRDFVGDTANYLNVGDVAAIDITGTALTVAAWIRPDVVTVLRTIVAKYSFGGVDDQYLLLLLTGKVAFLISDAAGDDLVTGLTTVSTGVWHHAAGVKNGTGAGAIAAYLDGISDNTALSNKSIANSARALTIGRYETATNPFDGLIAEVGIWNIALSAAEILALAKGVSPGRIRPENLKGYWPLWGVAFPEPDLSGNANNAALVGSLSAADHAPVGSPAPMAA